VPLPTKSRSAGRQNSKKLLGSERCNDDAPHFQLRLLPFELAPGLPATNTPHCGVTPHHSAMLTLFPGDQVFRQYEGCVGNPEVFPFSLPNLGADEIFSTGVSTGEHAVIVVSRM